MKTNYEDSLVYQINATAKYFDKIFEQFFKELNIGVSATEHLALALIDDLKDCCQRDLARIILKDRANTGKLARSLKEKGLIDIKLSTKNNRPVKILTTTKKGKDLLKNSASLFEPLKEKFEQQFSNEKLEEIKNALKDFTEVIATTLKVNI